MVEVRGLNAVLITHADTLAELTKAKELDKIMMWTDTHPFAATMSDNVFFANGDKWKYVSFSWSSKIMIIN